MFVGSVAYHDTSTTHLLPHKYLLIFLFLFGKTFGVEILHVEQFNFIDLRDRGVNIFRVYRLAVLGHDFYAFVAEEHVDEHFFSVAVRHVFGRARALNF
jgi:hypothetical protein